MQQEVTTIQGERVLLRPFQEGDAEEAARVWTPESTHMYGGSRRDARRPSVESRRHRNEQIAASGEHHFAIEADGRYIGFAILGKFDEANRSASWRGGIENSQYWGRGYGTEVVELMLRYAFNTLQLHRVHLRVAAYNVRALRCYGKCGFRVEGIERQSFQVDGEWHDDLLMAILREEWEAMRAKAGVARNGDNIRSYGPGDYEAVVELWRDVGFDVDERDDAAALSRYVLINPGLFLIAEADGSVVGTVLASWDGRRSIVYRMAVDPGWQRRGVGTRLMAEAERRLEALGARSVALLTWRDDEQVVGFYKALGYQIGEGVAFMMKRLDAAEENDDGSQCC